MNFAQAKTMPNLGLRFPAREGEQPTTFSLPYAAGLVQGAQRSESGKKLRDFLLRTRPRSPSR